MPTGPDSLHELKYDGYWLRLERGGERVRLITGGGYNWTARYLWIVESVLKIRHDQFVIDGEAVVLGVDGVADFDALHSRKHIVKCSSMPSTSWRWIATICGACSYRCESNLARLLARRSDGIFLAPFEQGEIGPDLSRRTRHGP